jgi:hypothetical protein
MYVSPVTAMLGLAICAFFASTVDADVVVLANRTGSQLDVRIAAAGVPSEPFRLPAGEVRPFFATGRAQIEFTVPGEVKRYQLEPNSAYYLGRDAAGRVDLQKIGFADEGTSAVLPRAPGAGRVAGPAVVAVKILVDEEEPARQFGWEQRLRRRIAEASAVLERHARVQLRVVAVGTWDSEDATDDFMASLREFEEETRPDPARVAIGFTSQFPMVRGRVHLAGTRGPLHSHILIREGSHEISEPERLEFLVHELGHYLGASHSPERTSVMRPVLGDNLAGRSDFQIRFDPVNTLIIAMIGEELARGNVQRFTDLSPATTGRLQSIYTSLARSLPNDPAGTHFTRLAESSANTPLIQGARRVLQGLVFAAAANRKLASTSNASAGSAQPASRTGDALTEYLVRQTASAAAILPGETGRMSLVLALAIGLDDTGLLMSNPEARRIAQPVESPQMRTNRLAALGEPTMLGRRDLVRRFFTSAYLAAALGAEAAKEASLEIELRDLKAEGFSFAGVAADRAGIRWGGEVARGRFTPQLVSLSFQVPSFMPPLEGLPADVDATQFVAKYGSRSDDRFQQQLLLIDQQIANLAAYRTTLPTNR